MQQKLSAMNYIKNNKRRVAVLVVSLTMSFVLFYLVQFLLSSATETFGACLVDNAKKVQYVWLPSYAFDGDWEHLTDEEWWEQICEEQKKLGERLEQEKEIQQVYFTEIEYVLLFSVIGQYYIEVPMLPKEGVENYMEHFNAKLVEGKIPEKKNEVLVDTSIMKNGSYEIGDSLEDYPDTKIVGIADCEDYFAVGVWEGESNNNPLLCILSDGSIEDMAEYLHELGYEFEEEDATIADVKNGEHDLQRDVKDVIQSSCDIVQVAVTCVLCITLFIVYISYLRDRRNEWCLYCSIGFSRKTIYASVMRELLFTFGLSFLLAAGLIAALVVILDHTMIQSMGLRCKYLYPDVILNNLCVYALFLGVLQIPIRHALYKIQTIDAMEDDLN